MLPGGGSLSQAERPETVEPSSEGSAGDTRGVFVCFVVTCFLVWSRKVVRLKVS